MSFWLQGSPKYVTSTLSEVEAIRYIGKTGMALTIGLAYNPIIT
jgi:hypothetical protein